MSPAWTQILLMLCCCRTAEIAGSGSLSNTRDERLGDVGLVVLDEVKGCYLCRYKCRYI
jgi:hypothetical protein